MSFFKATPVVLAVTSSWSDFSTPRNNSSTFVVSGRSDVGVMRSSVITGSLAAVAAVVSAAWCAWHDRGSKIADGLSPVRQGVSSLRTRARPRQCDA